MSDDGLDGHRRNLCVRCWYGSEGEGRNPCLRFWYSALTGPFIFVHFMTLFVAGCIVTAAGVMHLSKLKDLEWLDLIEPRPCQALELVAKQGETKNDRFSIDTSTVYMLPMASTWGAGSDFPSVNASYYDKPPQLVVWTERMWYGVGSGPQSVPEVEEFVGFESGGIFSPPTDSLCYYDDSFVRYNQNRNATKDSHLGLYSLSIAKAVPAHHPVLMKLPVDPPFVKLFSTILVYVFVTSWVLALVTHIIGIPCGAWTCLAHEIEETRIHRVAKGSLLTVSVIWWVALGLLLYVAWSGIDDLTINEHVEVPWGMRTALWSARWDAKRAQGYGP